jgi:O-antigen/teichoic acid export membrane protein
MPHDLSTQIASFASKVVLKNNESVSEVGIYSLANQFTSIIDLIQSTVNSAFQPWFFENMTHNNSERTREIIDFSYVLLVLYSIMYLLLGLFSQEAVMIMAEGSYVKAWTVIPILIVGFSIKSIYYFHVNIMLFNKKASKVLFIATISGSIIDIILAFLLVPYLGMYGSALAFGIAKIIVVVLVVILSRRFDSLRYNIIKMLSIIIPSLLFMAAGLFFSYTKYIYEFNWLNLSYKFVILFLYLLFVYLTNFKRINAAIIKIRQRKDRRKL